ncbi:MAG: hypothetical protein ACRD3G_11410 [Vicinamibacterales bacterium]
MNNFIRTTNPYSIAPPPSWFLAQLYAFDPDLVLFASLESPCYQVAKRLHYTRHCRPSKRYPDTRIFAIYNLHPVGRLLPSPMTIWGPQIIADLKAMSVDEVGGGDKAADRLDGFDLEEEQKFDVQLADCLDWWSGDAWRYLTQKHHDQAKEKELTRRSVPSIGTPNFRRGGSAVFVGQRHRSAEDLRRIRGGGRDVDVKTAPPKIVEDLVW